MNGIINRVFYTLKPLIPRVVQIGIRRRIARYQRKKYASIWPIDPRAGGKPPGWPGWPKGKQFAFVLSHDVDTAKGYRDVLKLAEVDERLGFRSCFNFVPERYGKIELSLLDELKRRGFGIGIHGLKHDGKLFMSKEIFDRSAKRINAYLAEWGTRGFSSPSMHHNLDWLPELNIDYAISTFDTDPFEPQPDGVGTIFPFAVPRAGGRRLEVSSPPPRLPAAQPPSGISPSEFSSPPPSSSDRTPCAVRRAPFINATNSSNASNAPNASNATNASNALVELPCTLPQDSTLFIVLQEKTIDIWKQKLDWVAARGGMVLFNTHPDYMAFNGNLPGPEQYPVQHYIDFLEYAQNYYPNQYHNALPSEIAAFFRHRCQNVSAHSEHFYRKKLGLLPRNQHIKPDETIHSDQRDQREQPEQRKQRDQRKQRSKRPLRVAMLTYSFYESDNRVRRYAETLVRRGDSVDVISLRRKGENVYNELNGVRIQRVQERVRDEKGKVDYLYRILKFLVRSTSLLTYRHLENPYDIVHVHSVPDFEVFAALVPKLMGASVILDIHDIVQELYSSKFKVGKDSMIFKLLLLAERMSIGFSDHVIISNDIWRKRLLSRSVSERKCTSILNYPDERLFFTGRGKKSGPKTVFMYPGTLNHHQGLDLAIEAFARIKDAAPQAEFHIYGDGPARKSLEEQIRMKGLKGKVFLFDPVPLDRIVDLMANADIGVIPKKNDDFGGDAFSTKTLEFMRLGVPIILSRTRVDRFYFSKDVVRFFEPGSSEELAAAMLEMVRDKALRERLATKGQLFAKKNSWDAKKHIYLNIIGSMIFKKTEGDFQANQQN